MRLVNPITTPTCYTCKCSGKNDTILNAKTYKQINTDFIFSSEELNHYYCTKCVQDFKKEPAFHPYKFYVDQDVYIKDDVYHLGGEAYFLILRNNMYALYYETSLVSYDWDTEKETEIPFVINVVIRGKSIIGTGSTKYRDIIDEMVECFIQKIEKKKTIA